MAAATLMVKLPDALYEVPRGTSKFLVAMRGIELELMLMIASLAIVLLGPGRIAMDALIFRKKKTAAEAAAVENQS